MHNTTFTAKAVLVSLSLLSAPLSALAYGNDEAVLGGLLGGAAGAAIGSQMDGRHGAIIGGAIGAGAGVAIATQRRDDRPRYDTRYETRYETRYQPFYGRRQVYVEPRVYEDGWRHDRGWHRGWRREPEVVYVTPAPRYYREEYEPRRCPPRW